jgi:hypothetical protein
MGVPTSEVGYTSATTVRGDHKVRKGHMVALEYTTRFNNDLGVCTVDKIKASTELWHQKKLLMYWCSYLRSSDLPHKELTLRVVKKFRMPEQQ